MKNYPDIQFAVLNGRPTVNRHLRRFGDQCANFRVVPGAPTWEGIFAVRNEIMAWFVEETNLPCLVVLDDDIVLDGRSAAFLDSTADVTGPRVVGATDGREVHPGDLSGAAFKLSRRAAHLLQGCWKVPRKGNCGCHSLFVMSKRLGLAVSKAGMVGHRIPMTAWPDGPAQFDAEVKIS